MRHNPMRRVLALLLCAMMLSTLVVTAFADPLSEKRVPPPELIILEGEEWIPDAVDPLANSSRGSDDECRHGGASPQNYRYIGAVRGNTEVDDFLVDAVAKVVEFFAPPPLDTFFSFTYTVLPVIFPTEKIEGEYIKYQYIYNVGPDPNMYWFHTYFSFATQGGVPIGEACRATYSPQKPGDPLQD